MSGLRQRERRSDCKVNENFRDFAIADKVNYEHGQKSGTVKLNIC